MAQLPANYSTGLLQQYAPRVNISTTYEKISETELASCQSQPHAPSVNYHKRSVDPLGITSGWGLQACMSGSLTTSPWKATRERQDFSEMLFLNITYLVTGSLNSHLESVYAQATTNTTVGYFELPNIMNHQSAGEFLSAGPPKKPGSPWERQVFAESFGP